MRPWVPQGEDALALGAARPEMRWSWGPQGHNAWLWAREPAGSGVTPSGWLVSVLREGLRCLGCPCYEDGLR